jgi:predicted GNAT family N-acyltransferase
MSQRPDFGELSLTRPLTPEMLEAYAAGPVRTLEEYQQAMALRAAVYLAEQDCPYDEEYDGNDFSCTHFLVKAGGCPAGTCRVRWFAGFAKIERSTILPAFRGTPALRVLMAETCEVISRKGYRVALAQIQSRLWPVWSRVFRCRLVQGRENFAFSGFDYCEMEIPIAPHPQALTIRADPLQIIRPEGRWDEPGVLDRSASRPTGEVQAA